MINLHRPSLWLFVLTPVLLAGPQTRPSRTFATHCAICHGADANGTDRAPAILPFVTAHSDGEIAALVHTGRVDRGLPKFDFTDAEMQTLTAHLRGLASGAVSTTATGRGGRGGGVFQPHPATLKLQDGRTLDGTLTSSTPFSATLLTADGKFHLLSRNGETYTERPLEPKRDWPSYDGSDNGNRFSSLEQINTTNVKRLAPGWIFPVPGAPRMEVTPVVIDGVMYLTGPNEAYALDATMGRQGGRGIPCEQDQRAGGDAKDMLGHGNGAEIVEDTQNEIDERRVREAAAHQVRKGLAGESGNGGAEVADDIGINGRLLGKPESQPRAPG